MFAVIEPEYYEILFVNNLKRKSIEVYIYY